MPQDDTSPITAATVLDDSMATTSQPALQTPIVPGQEVLTPVPVQSPQVNQSEGSAMKSTQTPPVDATRIMYWSETQKLVKDIEQALGMRVITLFIPLFSSLVREDTNKLFYHIEHIGKQEKLAVMLFGPGGDGKAAYTLVKLLRSYTKSLIAVVPEIAASALTMFSLGADAIMTGPLTTFSPIDSSLANHPLAPLDPSGAPVSVEITQIVKFLEMVKSDSYDNTDFNKGAYKALTDKVHPLLLGAIQRTFSLSKRLTAAILKTHFTDQGKIEAIVDKLNDEYPTHNFPVLAEDLKEMGIATIEMSPLLNRLCMNLVDLYRTYSEGGTQTEGSKRVSWDRGSVFESTGLRTWYAHETVSTLNEKNEWKRANSTSGYRHAGEIMTKQGYIKIDTLSTKQLKTWLEGKQVTEA